MLIALLIPLKLFVFVISLFVSKVHVDSKTQVLALEVVMIFSSYCNLPLCLEQFHFHSVDDFACLSLLFFPITAFFNNFPLCCVFFPFLPSPPATDKLWHWLNKKVNKQKNCDSN